MHDVRLLVKDNFLPDPERVRQEALTTPFGDYIGPDSELYQHVQVRPNEEFSEILSEAVGAKVSQSLTLFRINYAGELPTNPVHSDQCCSAFACVLYLNKPEDCRGGTAFWRNKATGWDSMPTEAAIRSKGKSPKREYSKIVGDGDNLNGWEQTSLTDMKFNRMIIYPSRRFHSRFPIEAFGNTVENGRLIWVSFFDV